MGFLGRRVIESSVSYVDKSNVMDVLLRSLSVHLRNSAEIDYLDMYRRGDQPILQRTKSVRPEICNRLVENHALEIVDFKTGYLLGEPIQYVRRGEGDDQVGVLNEYMTLANKSSMDGELATWFYTCGTAYRMVLPAVDGEVPFEMDILDPRRTFVVYNSGFGRRPLMGVTYTVTDGGETIYSVYTPREYFEISDASTIVRHKGNPLGDIPIVEYPANKDRRGAFEAVLTLLDAVNSMASNRADGIEQFVQSFMKFVNCDIDEDDFKALKDLGAIKIKGDPTNPADVSIISSELDQVQAQVAKDDLYENILTICNMPGRKGHARGSGDTGQAVLLREGWGAAETAAQATELSFKKSERQFLKLVTHILSEKSNLKLSPNDIEVKFVRNKTDNLLVKTQGLQNMLEAGMHPLLAITHSHLFSDPEQAYLDSLEYLEKWKTAEVNVTPGGNKPSPVEGVGV